MKYINKIITTLVFILLLGGCKEEKIVKKEVLRPVKFEVVGLSNLEEVRTFSGVAAAADEIDLSFRTSGIIIKLNAKIGQVVRRGALIAQLDNVEVRLAYEQSVSALNAALSAVNTAKSSLDRSRALYEKGSQSLSDYEAAKNNYQRALDQHQTAIRTKDIKKSQINYGYIYAPQNGIVAAKNMELNEIVSAGQVLFY